jgi:hypothetical protein
VFTMLRIERSEFNSFNRLTFRPRCATSKAWSKSACLRKEGEGGGAWGGDSSYVSDTAILMYLFTTRTQYQICSNSTVAHTRKVAL